MARTHKILLYEADGQTLIVTPAGDSLGVEERVLETEIAALHALIDSDEMKHVVVDIGVAPYFGSLMMGAMIALCRRATDKGGRCAMCNAGDGMLESIQIMRLDTIIPQFRTREEAMTFVGR